MKVKKISFNPLSKGFVTAKPIQWGEYNEKEIYRLEEKRRLVKTRKYHGWKLFAVKDKSCWKIYTDGIRNVTAYLPQIASEFDTLHFPNKSILVGEGVVTKTGSDNAKVGKILLTKNAKAALAAQKEFGEMAFVAFDIIFSGNIYMLDVPYIERLKTLKRIINQKNRPVGVIEIIKTPYDEAKQIVIKKNWEGLVLYDRDFVSSFRLDGGNPTRPEGCYKWKPLYEGDFFTRKWIKTDKDKKSEKEILLLQIDPKTGDEVDCGKHGTFSAEDFEKIQALLKKKSRVVLQFEFEKRTAMNKLVNKRFVGIRHDKKWQDCLMPTKMEVKNV